MKTTTLNEKNPVRIGILLEPLMEIFSHPDRNNLIREFFAAEEKVERLSDQDRAVLNLEKELKNSKLELEILKKAIAVFSKIDN